MFKTEKTRRLLSRFKKNEDGNIALTFAVSAVAVIGCMGAAMDFSTLSNADARSQAIADQTALAAAVFVKTNGREPNPPTPVGAGETPEPEEGYLDSSYRTYKASELGYNFKGWVDGGAENVDVIVDYDGILREAKVTVRGKTIPTFMQIFGHQNMDFEATAVAKYADYDLYDPASVVLVLDNSGSMGWDDKPEVFNPLSGNWEDQPGHQTRISALKTHAGGFMEDLEALAGDQTSNEKKILRTGMLAYSSDTVSARSVVMNWATQPVRNSLNRMVANGGTNSAPPMNTAKLWMDREDRFHQNMHGDDPLKFVVFMTDGVNTVGGTTWIAEEGTGQWLGHVCQSYRRWSGTCRRYKQDTVEQESRPNFGYGWEEGAWHATANISSVADCQAMKDDGVRIYTIGFALEEGYYKTNYSPTSYTYLSPDVRDKAYSFLTECSSEPSTFLTAENAEQLEEAFTRIGNDIQTEIIRLSN